MKRTGSHIAEFRKSTTTRCPARGCPFSALNCPDHDANGRHHEQPHRLEWMVRSHPHAATRGGGRRITNEQRRRALADSAWLRAARRS